MKIIASALLALWVTIPSFAKPQPVLPKFQHILSVLQEESVVPVSRTSLLESATRQLESELGRRGLSTSKGSPQERLEEACRQYPELCADGTVLRALVLGAGKALDDPYLTYLEPSAFAGLSSRMRGQQGPSAGFTIVKNHSDEAVKVLEVDAQGPTTLHAGDWVVSLDGRLTADMSVEEARARLTGEAGSKLHLQVVHVENRQVEDLEVARLECGPHTVELEVLAEPDGGRRIAHLRIRNFAATTASEVEAALAEAGAQKVDGLIVDLRNNGGGLVSAAVDVCAQFLPGGTPVVTLQRRHAAEVLRAEAHPGTDLPMVILLNQESASASEIMASALHDAKVATLVGTRSYGKGTVQRTISLGDGSGLKFTSARYQTPAGAFIHGTGIAPDVTESGDSLARGMQLLR